MARSWQAMVQMACITPFPDTYSSAFRVKVNAEKFLFMIIKMIMLAHGK